MDEYTPCEKHEVSNCGLCKRSHPLTLTTERTMIANGGKMTEYSAQRLARTLMDQHGLSDWRFKFDRSVQRFGICMYGPRVISLSRALTIRNSEAEVRDCILHEIAHALVGHEAGHGPVWQAKARSIGCDGRRCYDATKVERPDAPIIGTCPACGEEFPRHRMVKRPGSHYHPNCPKGAHRSPKQYITWRRVF